MFLLYCLPLLFKVWQRSGSCFCCYIVYHFCFRFDRWVVHVVVVILSVITVYGLTEEWFMLVLLYWLPLLFKYWQRSGSCFCYIVYYYCLRLTEEWFILLLLYCLPLLFKAWQRIGSCCCCYIVYHYFLRFDRGEVHAFAILFTITVQGLTEKWFMLWLLYCLPIPVKVWQRSGASWCYIVYHHCLKFDIGVIGVFVVVLILSTITF